MQLKGKEIAVLRELAKEYAEIASLPIQKEKMDLWKAFNRRDNVRPMVLIDQLPWHELDQDGSLTCVVEDRMFRELEWYLRRMLYQWSHFPVDMVLEPFLTIPYAARNSGYGIAIKEDKLSSDPRNGVVSHYFYNQLETEEDIEKIKDMVITCDREQSASWLQAAEYVFDGILPVRQAGGIHISLDLWDNLSQIMGVDTIFIELMDRPEFLHEIVKRMTHSALEGIRQVNELGLVDTSANLCHCSVIYTDELLPDFGAGKSSGTKNAWNSGTAQLFTSVSPEVTEEFDVPYMSQLSAEYGMFYYGCCDRLDHKLDIVQKIPNVKKISCSPWSDRENFAERLRKDIIMSNKPTPSFLAGDTMNCEVVRADLKRTCDLAKKNDIKAEMILKDISTVNYQPQRLTEWAKCAMEVVEQY